MRLFIGGIEVHSESQYELLFSGTYDATITYMDNRTVVMPKVTEIHFKCDKQELVAIEGIGEGMCTDINKIDKIEINT